MWEGRIVSESTLTSRINAARKAIGDSGEEQKLIRTITRRGFRFVGEIRTRSSSDEPGDVADSPPAWQEIPAPLKPRSGSIAAQPNVSFAWIAEEMPIMQSSERKHYLDGFRRAGLD